MVIPRYNSSRGWPTCVGMPGRHASEQVAGIRRNQWPACVGMGGRHGSEYAHIRSGGVYLCEDLCQLHYEFHDYVAGLARQLTNLGEAKPGVTDIHDGLMPNSLQRVVHSAHTYPFVSVIEKAEAPVREFTGPRHGTQWQPWLPIPP